MANNFDALTTSRVMYGRELLSQLKIKLFMARTVSRKYSPDGARQGGIVRVPNVSIPNVVKRAKNSGAITWGDSAVSYVDVVLTEHAIVPMTIDSIDAVITDIDFRTQMAKRAAYKIALAVETDLASLYKDIGNYVGTVATANWASSANATGAIALLDAAGAPDDRFGALSTGSKQSALQNPAFTQFNTAGPAGASALIDGDLGRRYGVTWGLAQGVATHTGGGVTAWGTPLSDGAWAVGAVSISVKGLLTAGALKKGDAFKITKGGVTYFHSLSADATAAGGIATVLLAQPLGVALVDGDALTVDEGVKAAGVQSMLYVPDAFAFAMAPMDDERPGTQSSIIRDEQTDLAIRVTYSWDHSSFTHRFTTELLYGFKTVRPELAVRMIASS